MMQNSVNVIEDVPLRDLLVAIVLAKMLQGPIGDILTAVAAILVIPEQGKALSPPLWQQVHEAAGDQGKHRPFASDLHPNDHVFALACCGRKDVMLLVTPLIQEMVEV